MQQPQSNEAECGSGQAWFDVFVGVNHFFWMECRKARQVTRGDANISPSHSSNLSTL